ncbi:MAG: hypothetical protein IPO21_10390 [Bacteroidales bacterium]|nr:hypothetical protein [Bacteroidales bacterium]
MAKVEFFNGTSLLKTVTSEPYLYTLTSAAKGNYTITAVATDDEGLSSSATCSFSVDEITASDLVHNFTLSGTSSTFFTITGNLSTAKGTFSYAGLNLTQCLKIESATNITFSTAKEATLVLVFNETFVGRIKINNTDYTAIAGIVTLTLPAGNHTILKTDSGNLYYMSITYTNTIPKAEQTIQLSEGWNMISLYVKADDASVAAVFPHATIVKTQNSFFNVVNKAYLNSLQTLEPGVGYLVYNTINETLTITGTSVSKPAPQLETGWNLIGIMTNAAIQNVFPTATIVKNFNGFYELGNSQSLFSQFEAGKAYFVKK